MHQRAGRGATLPLLQEFWFANSFVELYQKALGELYHFNTLQRSGWKDDGVAILIRKQCTDKLHQLQVTVRLLSNALLTQAGAQVARTEAVLFHDAGDRVALLVHVKAERKQAAAASASAASDSKSDSKASSDALNDKLSQSTGFEFLVATSHLTFPHGFPHDRFDYEMRQALLCACFRLLSSRACWMQAGSDAKDGGSS